MYPDIKMVLVEGYRETSLPDFTEKIFKHIKVHLPSVLWVKENLINIGVASLPDDWKYASWIDRDILFTNTSWVEETIQQLEYNDLVQPWTSCVFLDKDHLPETITKHTESVVFAESFCSFFAKNTMTTDNWHRATPSTIGRLTTNVWGGHPGQAWAITREFYTKLGGLYDKGIVGGADSLILIAKLKLKSTGMLAGIAEDAAEHIGKLTNARISSVRGLVCHYSHGEIEDRNYTHRHKILTNNQYSPETCLKYTSEGVLTYREQNTALEQEVYNYFKMRKEDGNNQ